mmetsp:Transcript_42681/g.122176  ORF Transcript_42681/g.122176 Transcript_42681/m.122176 type:complete len:110 (-) Transcript_42681:45-374(-)
MPALVAASPPPPRRRGRGESSSTEETSSDDDPFLGSWSSSIPGLRVLSSSCLDEEEVDGPDDLAPSSGNLGRCWGSGALQGALQGLRRDSTSECSDESPAGLGTQAGCE